MPSARRYSPLSRAPQGVVIGTLAIGATFASFLQSLVIPLLADIPTIFSVTQGESSWILTATLVSGAIVTPVAGRLGDLYGKRRVLLLIVTTVLAGSVVAALSPNLSIMIVGRALQGALVGVIPLGISILRDILPRDRLTGAVGLVSSSLGVGGALGFPLSAVIYQHLGWQALYWTAVILMIVLLAALYFIIPATAITAHGSFDYLGALVLSLSVVCILLAISRGPEWGLISPITMTCLGTGIILLIAWLFWELRHRSPLVDIRLSVRPTVLLTNLAGAALGFSVFGFQVITPIVVQLPPESGVGLGASVIIAGLCLMPAGLMMLTFSPIGARVSLRFGAKWSLAAGSTVIAAGYLAAPVAMDSLILLGLVSLTLGIGFGFTFGAIPTLIMSAVPPSHTAAANGLNSLVRSVGSATGSAVYGVILSTFTLVFNGTVQPDRSGLELAYVVSGLAMLIGGALALSIPRKRSIDR
ncbi:MFS transporter [Ruicaihuangia caeni]|uniref:MFS transporter n=1 Tax=Ruicaihuangia caeni TaxID=3042517 RepID=UPI00339021F0